MECKHICCVHLSEQQPKTATICHKQDNIIIMIIQEISAMQNPQLKARAQCTHRKTQNKYLYIKKINKKQSTTCLPHHGQSYTLQRKNKRISTAGNISTSKQFLQLHVKQNFEWGWQQSHVEAHLYTHFLFSGKQPLCTISSLFAFFAFLSLIQLVYRLSSFSPNWNKNSIAFPS